MAYVFATYHLSRNVATSAIDNYMLPLMDDFRKWGCSESSTFKFWDMFAKALVARLNSLQFSI
jgi:hypothetical protein